jgi:hypothetical protein
MQDKGSEKSARWQLVGLRALQRQSRVYCTREPCESCACTFAGRRRFGSLGRLFLAAKSSRVQSQENLLSSANLRFWNLTFPLGVHTICHGLPWLALVVFLRDQLRSICLSALLEDQQKRLEQRDRMVRLFHPCEQGVSGALEWLLDARDEPFIGVAPVATCCLHRICLFHHHWEARLAGPFCHSILRDCLQRS